MEIGGEIELELDIVDSFKCVVFKRNLFDDKEFLRRSREKDENYWLKKPQQVLPMRYLQHHPIECVSILYDKIKALAINLDKHLKKLNKISVLYDQSKLM